MSTEEKKSINAPRLMILGTNRQAGTSTFLLGLLVALKRQGFSVAVSKVGTSLIDSTHHRRVSGRLSHTLDSWLLNHEQLLNSVGRLASGAEIMLIEGSGGPFDKLEDDGIIAKQAELAAFLNTPVVLLVDGHGYQESIAALVQGFDAYDPRIKLSGVVANHVATDAQDKRLRHAIEALNGPKYLGGIREGDPKLVGKEQVEIEQGNPSLLTRNRLMALGDLVQETVDLEAIERIAMSARPLQVDSSVLEGRKRRCRVAVADDAAFHITIQDNLDLIRRAGAEIVAFSPLADLKIPAKTGGIYFPAGYAHLYAADLQANTSLMQSIREFAAAGGVIFSEGNSLSYLCKQMVLSGGERFEMLGIIPGVANAVVPEQELVDPVFCEVVSHEETIVSRTGDKFRGVRDTRWLVRLEERVLNCFQLRDRSALRERAMSEITPTLEGLSPEAGILATAVLGHWGSNPRLAPMFVDSVSSSMPAMNAQQKEEKR